MQTVGTIGSAIHKRTDTAAAALYRGLGVEELADLDLSHTLPLGRPLNVLEAAARRRNPNVQPDRRHPQRLNPGTLNRRTQWAWERDYLQTTRLPARRSAIRLEDTGSESSRGFQRRGSGGPARLTMTQRGEHRG